MKSLISNILNLKWCLIQVIYIFETQILQDVLYLIPDIYVLHWKFCALHSWKYKPQGRRKGEINLRTNIWLTMMKKPIENLSWQLNWSIMRWEGLASEIYFQLSYLQHLHVCKRKIVFLLKPKSSPTPGSLCRMNLQINL